MSEPISSGGVMSAVSTKVGHWLAGIFAAAAPIFGAVTAQWIGMCVGSLIGVLTYRTTKRFMQRRDDRERILFEAQMQAIREGRG